MRYAVPAALAAVLIAVLTPAPSYSTVRPVPIKIRWVGEVPTAQASRSLDGRFEIVAARPGVLERVEVVGDGWNVNAPADPGVRVMGKADRRAVAFKATPVDPAAPLVIRATFDGQTIEKRVWLDGSSRARGKIAFASGSGPQSSAKPEPRTDSQLLRLSGRFTYVREDGLTMGADNIRVRVWDDDSPDPFDEVIWEGFTDINGNFDVVVDWSDCDISGCDDPDIYLEVIARGPVADVQDTDVLETTYSWTTGTYDDFTGSHVAFGDMLADPATAGAVHVYTNVVRAHRTALTLGNVNTPFLDVLWPDPEWSFYDSDGDEMHIAGLHTWDELVHAHEFMHHMEEIFSVLDPTNYENGFCDQPRPGHCVWCPENESDAWQEGIANWFGRLVTERYAATYGMDPWANGRNGLHLADGLGTCNDGMQYPSTSTEGYVMALLRDIEDLNPSLDDHDGTSVCDRDGLELGPGAIFTVFLNDNVQTVRQFIDAFRLRYWEHDQDFHITALNVGTAFSYPTPVPVVRTQPASCVTARVGEAASFQVITRGDMNGVTPLKFQWRRNGLPLFDDGVITGSNASTLQLYPVNAFLDGVYDCVVTTCNDSFSTQSLAGRLTVLPAAVPKGVVAWGNNQSGHMGTGGTGWRVPPAVIPNLNLVQVEGGVNVVIGLRADGQVMTWGYQQYGELGNGTYTPAQYTPALVPEITDVLQVRAGQYHKLVLKRDGTVWGWGYNERGALADSSYVTRNVPVHAKALSGCVRAIACGANHSLALMSDGTVMAWGLNANGALGRGTVGGFSNQPLPVQGLSDVEAIAAAGDLNLALKYDGTVWAWGSNQDGSLGIGQDSWVVPNSPVPVQVQNLPVIRKIACYSATAFAISNEGAAYSWGSNQYGILGAGLPQVTHRTLPGLMPGLTLPVQIVTGHFGWAGALLSDGTVHVWGYNYDHVAGRALPSEYMYSPVQVSDVHDVIRIGSARATVFALGELTGVTSTPEDGAPAALTLRAAPNPSVGRIRIAFDLPRAGHVSLAVYDLAGRRVRTLLNEVREAGRYDVAWDGRGDEGGPHAAGVYFVRLEHAGELRTERLVRMR